MFPCVKSKIVFNTDSLEKIVLDPLSILKDEESFWKEKPQEYYRQWAKAVVREIPYAKWRESIRNLAEIPYEERKNHIIFKNTMKIVKSKEEFIEKALPHLCSYLPKDVDLSITIYFTAFIEARAFAMGEIVINPSASYWNNNVENILNTIVHEIFHVGYSYCRGIRKEEPLADETLYSMLDNFQSEGICTYVGYRALPFFPAPDEQDYKLLHDAKERKRLLDDVNEVFSKIGELPEDELQKLAWDKCVIGRGYYVVGAFMCKTIEEKIGKESLIETLIEGPATFVKLYNSLVEDDLKIRIAL